MKAYRMGTHRAVSPEQTLERIRPFFAAMGITRLANITGLDDIGIPVVTACRPNAKAVAVSQGKGVTLAAAKASAAMEAIETYHAENIQLPLKFCRYSELVATHTVVDVSYLPQMDIEPFAPNANRLWVKGVQLQSNRHIYVPYDVVHCDFTLPLPHGSGSFQLSTNGLASGNTKEEAICHGLCEVIERDALTLWSLTQPTDKQTRKVDLNSIDESSIQALIAQIKHADVMVNIWDITSDIGVPTFQCTIINQQEKPYRPLYPMTGSGTHPDKHIALLRAITEAVQARLTLISGSRDDISVSTYQSSQQLHQQKALRQRLSQQGAHRNFADIQSWDHDTFQQDLIYLCAQLEANQLPLPIVVDLTKPEFDIPVVKVIPLGLEGLHHVLGYRFGLRAQALKAHADATRSCKESL